MTIEYIKQSINDKMEIIQKILDDKELLKNISRISEVITNAYKNSNKLIVAGNGGSAADTEHIVGELVSRFNLERKALPAISLVSNFPVLTAVANDYGYDTIFEKQIEGYSKKGDVYLALSTSGNSKNIIKSLIKAKELGVITIGFTQLTFNVGQ